MNLSYHITAKDTLNRGTKVRQRGVGSLLYRREERVLLENVARQIARAHQYYSIFLVPQRDDGLSAKVYFRMLDGEKKLCGWYSSKEFWEEMRAR
jgi:hypothetical protein